MKKIYYIAIVSILIIVTSCEKDIKVTIPYDGDKIVLNSFIRQDSFIYAQVFKTQKLSQNNNTITPSGAVVQLFENGNFIQNLILQNINGANYFKSNIRAKANFIYTLKASANSLTSVEGQDTLPVKPKCRGVSLVTNTINNNSEAKAQIKINDPVNEVNYYAIRMYSADTNTSAIGPRYRINKQNEVYFTADVVNNSSIGTLFGGDEDKEVVFSDENFNGREITISLKFTAYYNGNLYVAPEVISLSKSAYRYLLSVKSQLNNNGNPFAEVSVIYNNIKNGYGIVAGTSDSLFVIRKQ